MVSVDIAGYGASVATERAQSRTLVLIRDGTLLRHPSDSTGHSPSKPKQPTKYLSLMSAVFLSPTTKDLATSVVLSYVFKLP